MRKTRFTSLATILAVAIMLWGCNGLKKMVKNYPQVKYEVTPDVLETHGGKINVTVKGTIPPKYFAKKAVVKFVPVLKYQGGELTLDSLTLAGEKAQVTGKATTVKYKEGGSFSYSAVIPYKPEMNKSELVVNPKASVKKKSVFLSEKKLMDGVIYTSERSVNDEDVFFATDKYEKETLISETGSLFFPYSKFNLDMKLPENKKQANIDQLDKFTKFAMNGWVKKSTDIKAWASPEGEEKFNQNLSNDRAKTAEDYLKKTIEDKCTKDAKDKAPKGTKVKPIKDTTNYTKVGLGEDWDGFVKALQASDFKDKSTILNVINSQADHEKKQKEIKNMTLVYKEVETEILPALRKAVYGITSYKPKKTDAQMADWSVSKPDTLELEEIIYASTLTTDESVKLKVYKNAIKIYPQDWRAYNNAASILLNQGNNDEAAQMLEKANTLSPNNGMVLNGLGAIASRKKDNDGAMTYFESAQGKGQNTSYNKGIIMIRKGDYPGATTAFSGRTCSYNVALVQLLQKDNNAAATLECVKNKTAEVYYLMAVTGARTGNMAMITENLKKAIEKDGKYKDQAKDDREFLKYFSNSQFQDAIK